MIDTLKEIISYSHALGFLDLVKVVGTDTTTELTAIAADKTVVLNSSFVQPVKELEGVFGLHDLGRLNTILNIPEYKENAFITVTKAQQNGNDIPVGIAFANASRDFRNDYRFMSRDVIEEQIPQKTRKPITWNLSIAPSDNSIQRLKFQAQAAGTTETFTATVTKGNLCFALGDHSSHTGEFVFSSGVVGDLKTPREWPLAHVLAILNLTGDKTLSIADAGAMEIKVTSGLAVHSYTVLSRAK
jgi:hypothetical protein